MFLNLESGVTRGAVPSAERYEKLRNAMKEHKKMLKSKDREIEEQAKNLKIERQRISKKKTRKNRKREIFRLKNELRAAKEHAESAPDGCLTPQAVGKPEVGTLPDFVVIGAQKCGTTSLYNLLTLHPYVERAVLKELHYFDLHFDKDIEWYQSQFPPKWKYGRRAITGEATPRYLPHPLVPERMAQVIPQARLIVLLRNPVDRAYSHYHHQIKNGRETRSFEEAIEAEKTRMLGEEDETSEREHRSSVESQRYLGYLSRGIYVDQLLRWSKFFSDEQMLVLKSEDFFEHTAENLKLILDFLGLPNWKPETLEARNEGNYSRGMDPETRRQLEEYFEPHNQRLYEYLGVNFGW